MRMVVVVGLSGSGKTLLGRMIANQAGVQFADMSEVVLEEYRKEFNLGAPKAWLTEHKSDYRKTLVSLGNILARANPHYVVDKLCKRGARVISGMRRMVELEAVLCPTEPPAILVHVVKPGLMPTVGDVFELEGLAALVAGRADYVCVKNTSLDALRDAARDVAGLMRGDGGSGHDLGRDGGERDGAGAAAGRMSSGAQAGGDVGLGGGSIRKSGEPQAAEGRALFEPEVPLRVAEREPAAVVRAVPEDVPGGGELGCGAAGELKAGVWVAVGSAGPFPTPRNVSFSVDVFFATDKYFFHGWYDFEKKYWIVNSRGHLRTDEVTHFMVIPPFPGAKHGG